MSLWIYRHALRSAPTQTPVFYCPVAPSAVAASALVATSLQGARCTTLAGVMLVTTQVRARLSSTSLAAARSLCTKIRPLSDEWARVGLGANRAAPHEKLNRLLFVQCGFGCDRESRPGTRVLADASPRPTSHPS